MNLLNFLLLQTPAPVNNGGEPSAPLGGAVWENIIQLFRVISRALPYLAVAVFVFGAFLVISRFAERAVKILLRRMRFDENLAGLLGGFSSIILTFLGLTLAVLIVFPGFDPLQVIAGLSAVTVVASFIFKDLSENFYSGVLILWRKPYAIGDQIRIGEHTGVVEGVTFRSTMLKTLSNELVFVPNSHILAGELIVKTAYKTRRLQLKVRIGLADDIETARRTIRQAVLETEGVVAADEKPIVAVSEFGESSVNFTVYFLAASDPISGILAADRAATNIRYALDEAGIKIPYEHTVVLFQDQTAADGDGKAGQSMRPAARREINQLSERSSKKGENL